MVKIVLIGYNLASVRMPEPCRNARGGAEQVHALPARQTERRQQREPQAGAGHATRRQGRNRPLDIAE